MKNKGHITHPLDSKIEHVISLLEQLIAVQMYQGGATQQEIASNFGVSVGKVNGLIKGVKPTQK